jgi:hypothetical protein
MDAKRVFPSSRDDIIAAAPAVSCVRGNIEEQVVLEAGLVACPVKANVATVKGLSHV